MMKRTSSVFLAIAFLSCLSISTPVCAQRDSGSSALQEQRRNQLLGVIDEELGELSRLSKKNAGKNPRLLLRMAELHFEKARLVKEKENSIFLAIPPAQRKGVSKKDYFKESLHHFTEAQKIGTYMLDKYPKFDGIGDVYYILAFNAKEFGRLDQSKEYLQASLKNYEQGGKSNSRAEVALAEMYFNDGRFKDAFKLYDHALKNKEDKWWTKNASNMAWCAYHNQDYAKAISIMRDVLETSKDKKYIDFSDSAARDLGQFYTDAGKIDDALAFYKSQGRDTYSQMLKLGKVLIDKNQKAQAKTILKEAQDQARNDKERIEVGLLLLDLDLKFANFEDHLTTSKKLFDIHKRVPFGKDDLELYIYQLKKMSAIVQRQAVSEQYKDAKKYRELRANAANEYFDILAQLENKADYKTYYLQAETLYGVADYKKALLSYQKAFDSSKTKGDYKYQKMSLEGLLSCLGQDSLPKETKEEFYVPVYTRYLAINRDSKQANAVYQKLFKVYMDKNDVKNAEKTLLDFRNDFPEDKSTQEGMLALVMDYHIKNKNNADIRQWTNRINNGQFDVSDAYAKKLRQNLVSMQFENVEKSLSKGQKKEALVAYYEIYKDKDSLPTAKANAAYNMAIFFHELGRSMDSYKWAKKSLELMPADKVAEFDETFLTISTELFNRRQIDKSAELTVLALKKICKTKSSKKDIFFKNAFTMYLADNKADDTLTLIEDTRACQISQEYIDDADLESMRVLAQQKRWQEYSELIDKLAKDKKNWPNLIRPLFDLRSAYNVTSGQSEAVEMDQRIMKYYRESIKSNYKIPAEGLDVVAHLQLIGAEKEIKKFHAIRLEFPEEIYNKRFVEKAKQLGIVTDALVKILDIGSGKGNVKAYQYLVETYQRFVNEARAFSPPGKSPEYVASFRDAMSKQTQAFLDQSLKYIDQGRNLIQKNSILSRDNYWFISKERLPVQLEYRYPRDGITMDRRGQG